MTKTINLDDGKYTIIYDKNNQYPIKCLRYGEGWKDLIGDNLIFWLCKKIEELEEKTNDMRDQLDYYDDKFGNMTV